jgi:hypothetical protein
MFVFFGCFLGMSMLVMNGLVFLCKVVIFFIKWLNLKFVYLKKVKQVENKKE